MRLFQFSRLGEWLGAGSAPLPAPATTGRCCAARFAPGGFCTRNRIPPAQAGFRPLAPLKGLPAVAVADRLPAGGRYVLLLTKPAGKGEGWQVEVAEVGRSWELGKRSGFAHAENQDSMD